MNKHKTENLTLPQRLREKSAKIDKEIAPLIEELWRLGFRADFCCQGDDVVVPTASTQAYIAFGSIVEAALFAVLFGPMAWDT